jgi:hypothetical protein
MHVGFYFHRPADPWSQSSWLWTGPSADSRSAGGRVTPWSVRGDRRLGQTCHKCLRQISEWSMWPALVSFEASTPLHINCYIQAGVIKPLHSLELMNFQTNWPYLSPPVQLFSEFKWPINYLECSIMSWEIISLSSRHPSAVDISASSVQACAHSPQLLLITTTICHQSPASCLTPAKFEGQWMPYVNIMSLLTYA